MENEPVISGQINDNWENVPSSIKSGVHEIKHIKKIACRYGRGCTHTHDPTHNDRFWHPPVPVLNGIFFNFFLVRC